MPPSTDALPMTVPFASRPAISLQQEIRSAAWRQIAQSGPAGLCLDEIAHELNVTEKELSNYFRNADALLTSLIIDAHSSFGDYQISARDSFAGVSQFLQRFMAIAMAHREWALRYPERYQLIFSPLPSGCQPNMDILRPFAIRSMNPLLGVVRELRAARLVSWDAMPLLDLAPGAGGSQDQAPGRDEQLVSTLALLVRSRLHGLVCLELAGQLPSSADAGAALYEFEIKSIVKQFIDL